MITQQEHDEAVERGQEQIRNNPGAIAVRFDLEHHLVTVDLNRGFSISFSPSRAQGLECATEEELSEIEITSSGLGIYFPKVDVDLWVPGLVKGRFGNDKWEAAWAEAHQDKQAA